MTLAEVVRRAVDVYLDQTGIDARGNLAATFGADVGAAYPDRGEWDRG